MKNFEISTLVNTLTSNDNYSCLGLMLSVGTIHFEDRFCTSRKIGIGGGGWFSPLGDSTLQLLQLAVHCIPQ